MTLSPKKSKGFTGKQHSKESKLKMSETHKHIARFGLREYNSKPNSGSFKKGNVPWNKGKRGVCFHSEETRRKMSASHKGKKFTVSHRKRIAATLRGVPLSPERRKKISLARNGQKLSSEHRLKLIKALRNIESPSKEEVYFYNSLSDKIKKILCHNSLTHEVNFNGIEPDFISKNKNRVVEYFGDYWHDLELGNNIPFIQTEKGRRRVFRKHGYDLLVVWASNFKKDPQKQINRVAKFLEV